MTTALVSPSSASAAVRIGPLDAPPPKQTLGNSVIDWCEENLMQPDGPEVGQDWRFTPEQVLFVLNWFAIDDQGRFVYRSGVLRRMKGWGKNPLGAALCAVEFIGPSRFDSFGKRGLPIAKPLATTLVRVAAVASGQTRNVTTLFPAMFRNRLIADHGVELGKEIIYAHGGRSRIETLTSSARSTEGGRPTFQLRDETQGWLERNDGHAMAKTLERDAAKSRGGQARVLSLCNAHVPGEDSVAERDWDAFQKILQGRSRARGLLYDALEAPPDTDLADLVSLRRGLELARGDSTWLDVDRLIEEILDPRTAPSEARRWYLNQIVAAEDAWIAPHEWDSCAAPAKAVAEGDEITLGFDGSETDDHTVLIGCRVSDSHLFPVGIWEPKNGEIPRADVDAAVDRAFTRYLINGFYADVHPWESYVDRWEVKYGAKLYVRAFPPRHPIAWDLRGRQQQATKLAESLQQAIIDRDLSHPGDPRFSQYVYNARRRPNSFGVTFGKEHRESARKVDAVSGAMLARAARQDYLALPEDKRRRRRSGRVMYV